MKSRGRRHERRIAERRAKAPVELRFALSPDEATIVEEALAWWVHQTREDLEGLEMTEDQTWALWRAEKLRLAITAALKDRRWIDHGPRDAPTPRAATTRSAEDEQVQERE